MAVCATSSATLGVCPATARRRSLVEASTCTALTLLFWMSCAGCSWVQGRRRSGWDRGLGYDARWVARWTERRRQRSTAALNDSCQRQRSTAILSGSAGKQLSTAAQANSSPGSQSQRRSPGCRWGTWGRRSPGWSGSTTGSRGAGRRWPRWAGCYRTPSSSRCSAGCRRPPLRRGCGRERRSSGGRRPRRRWGRLKGAAPASSAPGTTGCSCSQLLLRLSNELTRPAGCPLTGPRRGPASLGGSC